MAGLDCRDCVRTGSCRRRKRPISLDLWQREQRIRERRLVAPEHQKVAGCSRQEMEEPEPMPEASAPGEKGSRATIRRNRICDLLREALDPLPAKKIAEILGEDESLTKYDLRKMRKGYPQVVAIRRKGYIWKEEEHEQGNADRKADA